MSVVCPSARVVALTLFLLPPAAQAALAGSLAVTCEREDAMVHDWKGPLSVIYEGDDQGTITVSSAHLSMALPAARSSRTGEVDGSAASAEAYQGAADLTAIMPDLAALQACTVEATSPEFRGDPDMLAVSMIGCVPKVAPSPVPVPIHASVNVVVIPGDPGVIIEIKRRYAGPSDAAVTLESYPVNCIRDPG